VKLRERIALWFAWRKAMKQARPWIEKVLGRPLTRKELKMSNWKTSLLGVIAGLTGGTAVGWVGPDGAINWWTVALAIITSAFGYFAKDKDVGGVH
jgi:hypothetical protein